jgi:hypothetical protein
MTDNADVPNEIVEICDFESVVHQMALQGISFREIAKRYKVPIKRVREVIELACTPVTAETRGWLLRLELDRCDVFQAAVYEAAANGDPAAIAISLKVMEHRAAIGGLYAAASARVDPAQLVEAGKPKETSTDKMQRVLDEIAAGRPKLIAGKDVDVVPDDGAPDEAAKTWHQ